MAMLLHFLLSSALLFHPVVTEIHDIRLRHDRIKKRWRIRVILGRSGVNSDTLPTNFSLFLTKSLLLKATPSKRKSKIFQVKT